MSTIATHPLVVQHAILADPHHWDGGPGWWIIFPILWFVLIASVVTFCILGARRHRGRWGTQAGQARLSERFAAGEIDEQEYRQRLAVLKERP